MYRYSVLAGVIYISLGAYLNTKYVLKVFMSNTEFFLFYALILS